MPISYVGAGAVAAGTASVTVGLPSGLEIGDLMLMVVETANQTVTVPGIWLDVPSSPQGTGTAAGTASTRLKIMYRWEDGTVPDTTLTDPGNHVIARIVAYRGVDQTNPFNASAGSVKTTASTTATFPDIITTVADCWVLMGEAHALPDSNSTTIAGTRSGSNLTGVTERIDNNTNAGNGGGFSLADGVKATAGSVTGGTVTLTTSTVGAHITLALTPAPEAQGLTPNRFDNSEAFNAHTLTVGAVALNQDARLDNGQAFYAATITQPAANQALTQDARLDNGQTFSAHTLSTTYGLTASRLNNSQTFYDPAVGRGAVALTPARLDNEQTFPSPTVSSGAVALTATRLDNTQTFYSPEAGVGGVTLTASRLESGQAIYAPAVSVAGADLTQTQRLESTQTFPAASVSVSGVTLTAARLESSQSIYVPSVAAGAIALEPQRIDNGQSFYPSTVVSGPVSLLPERLDNSGQFYAASISSDTQGIFFPEWVEPGHVESGWVAWPYFNTNQFFAATTSFGLTAQRQENTQTFYPSLALLQGYPNPSDVREGEVYGPGGVYTGTMKAGGGSYMRRR